MNNILHIHISAAGLCFANREARVTAEEERSLETRGRNEEQTTWLPRKRSETISKCWGEHIRKQGEYLEYSLIFMIINIFIFY